MKTMIPALSLSVLLISGCNGIGGRIEGSGHVITETRGVSNFDRVSMGGSGELILTQGDNESLTVEAEDNIMEYVKTEVEGRTLVLGLDSGGRSISTKRSIRFTLMVKNLVGLDLAGSGRVDAGGIDTDRLDVDVSGSGTMEIDSLAAETLKVSISGSGRVELGTGEVQKQDIEMSGSGRFRADKLRSQEASIEISGSGSAVVWAQESLEVSISGSGDVEYYGRPRITQQVSGSGSIKSLGNP
ncbi:DUF2807 domain-containing protein [Candidatus Poribacteria bacterium]|nr:DUF2807 domain-containing protein [Candidatus Poribacteria bacterium]